MATKAGFSPNPGVPLSQEAFPGHPESTSTSRREAFVIVCGIGLAMALAATNSLDMSVGSF